ncbi:MAG: glycosyltransferase family 4 protein [Cyanobacteria bacterium P01_H01_bin.121]
MRIFFLSVHPPHGGGSANSSQELAIGLRQLGHEVLHVAPSEPGTIPKNYPGLIWMPTGFAGSLTIPVGIQLRLDQRVQLLYQEHGPFDLVLLGRESFLWQIPALRKVHRGPIVGMCRGAYINQLTQDNTIDPNLRRHLYQLYRSCDLMICIAQHLEQAVQTTIGQCNTCFLPNPINLPLFTPVVGLPTTEPLRLLMAAQIKARKRPFDALHIVQALAQRGVNVRLQVFGDGVQRSQFLDSIADQQLSDRVEFYGKVPRQTVLEALKTAEIVLLCSDNEGRPRVLQEAIAAGKGVVAADNPGSREVVQDWVDPWSFGRLYPIGDAAAAAEAIAAVGTQLRRLQHPPLSPRFPAPLEVLRYYEECFLALLKPSMCYVTAGQSRLARLALKP